MLIGTDGYSGCCGTMDAAEPVKNPYAVCCSRTPLFMHAVTVCEVNGVIALCQGTFLSRPAVIRRICNVADAVCGSEVDSNRLFILAPAQPEIWKSLAFSGLKIRPFTFPSSVEVYPWPIHFPPSVAAEYEDGNW